MTLLANASLSMINTSMVFAPQSAYISMELYYALVALFLVLISGSLFLDGKTKPFEKLFAAIVAFIFSVGLALASFSLAIINYDSIGVLQQINNVTNDIQQQQAIAPIIIMQNSMVLQIINWIVVIACFVNIINCVLILKDYSDIQRRENYQIRRNDR
jgi:hypothetical protein